MVRQSHSKKPPVLHSPGGFFLSGSRSTLRLVLVYVTARGEHFHSTPECRFIRLGQITKHSSAPTHAVPINSISGLPPCKGCYPDAPRAKFIKLRCSKCRSARPCAHNGGIEVLIPRVWRKGSALLPKGAITYRRDYVWPDQAHHYARVGETEQV